jgi:hypothetical protein
MKPATRQDRESNVTRRGTAVMCCAMIALTAVACAEAHEEVEREALEHAAAEAPELSAEEQRIINDIRATVDAWRTPQDARAAGYTTQSPPGCIQLEHGAQGVHYRNDAYFDGRTTLHQPQMLLYEPQPDGSLELVGVEYVVPIDQARADQPPTLLGRPLRRDDEHGWWRLHVWTHRENPDGMFALYNANVSCAHAAGGR